VFIADLPARLAGDASCTFLHHFHSLPAGSGTRVSNLYSHLEHLVSAVAGNFLWTRSEEPGSWIWLYFIQPVGVSC